MKFENIGEIIAAIGAIRWQRPCQPKFENCGQAFSHSTIEDHNKENVLLHQLKLSFWNIQSFNLSETKVDKQTFSIILAQVLSQNIFGGKLRGN